MFAFVSDFLVVGGVDECILSLSFAQHKQSVKKCPRYERLTSFHRFNFPKQIFYGTVFHIHMYVLIGGSYLGHLFPICFNFHGLDLLLVFRFLWMSCVQWIDNNGFLNALKHSTFTYICKLV
jgi:hypothetical protein